MFFLPNSMSYWRREGYETIVATGTWFYDKTVPYIVIVYSIPAKYSYTRFDEDEVLDETRPIPASSNGLLYKTVFGGEEQSLEAIKFWADSQPWGPVKWDEEINYSYIKEICHE